ncbi:MAG TPA: response regulator [Longimicrobium sp.]|nr:response regulator [Longimicrobium sp.]
MNPATVLIVEDDDATAYWVRRVLAEHGTPDGGAPHVMRAATLGEALPALRRADCVLVDLTLPDSRGIGTFLAIHHAAPSVPVVVLTSLRDEELGAEAVRLGAQDFLSKDAAPEQISRAVRYALLRGRWQGAVDEAARLEAVLDSISDAYLTVDGGGRLTYANRAAERLFRVVRGQAAGHPLEEGIPALAGTRTLAALLREGGEPAPAALEECLPAIGRWVEVRLFPSPAGITAYLRDTTERRRTEDALREAQRFTAGLLSNLPGMAYRCANDRRWTMEFASEGARELTGYAAAALTRPGGVSYADMIHPADREWVWGEVQAAVQQGRSFELSYRIIAADGSEKWVWEQGRAVRDGEGKPSAVEGFVTDTTRQKALEEQLRQAQKMDAVGRLAGGIAHDFNNLLTAIKGTASLMLLDLAPGDPLREDAEAIGEVVDRAAGLARQLLAFGRGHVVRRETVDLNRVVDETAKMLRRLIPSGIELTTVLAGELAPVSADGGQLEQVLVNLVLNARDAMPDGGTVIVETMHVEVDAWPRGWATGLAPGAYVMLVVHDTGTGIDAQTQERIFDPFFTTKAVGQGTGLGLSIVYGIVQQSGGAVRVFSRPGEGTTFRVLFPRAGAPARPRTPEPPPSLPGTWSGTVLLADDEPVVRRTTRRLLERAGFTVIDAGNGEEALRHTRAHAGPLALVVTDVVMPQMGGPALAAQLARERPGTPVLYVSGYSEENAFPGGSAAARGRFLHKPFTVEGLMEAVEGLLGQPRE